MADISGFPADDGMVGKQALRLRRFYMSVATYATCGALAQICAWLDYLPAMLPTWWMAGALGVNLVFYALLRSGRNLRFGDPSMTEAQLMASMVAVMVLTYNAHAVRGAFLMLFPVPMLFGVLRLHLVQLARVATVGIVGYAAVIATLVQLHPERVQLGVEMLNLLALAGVMGFVCLMCAYISTVRVELSHSLATIRDMAQHDALTGVFNRRHLMETLELEVQRCSRKVRRGLALCLIDIDHFKQINDTFGHPVGDGVLQAVGRCIAASIRSIDYLARYGGEEFVVLLDMETSDDWSVVCERTRLQVQALELSSVGGRGLSISIGVAQYVPGDSAANLLDRADRALYLAKADGRNCIRRAASVGA